MIIKRCRIIDKSIDNKLDLILCSNIFFNT